MAFQTVGLIGRLSFAAALAVPLSACSRSEPPPPERQPAPPPASLAPGTVTGMTPATQSGMPAVVVLAPSTEMPFPPQSEVPIMDQVGQTFGPSVLLVRTGQPVEFRNSDDTLHNVHVTNEETREGAFNVAIPTGTSYTFTFPRDGFYHVGCDIHPAMAAEIFSTTSPYAAIADADGQFEFDGVAPGAYVLTMYANGKRTDRPILMKGEPITVDLRSGA